MKSIILFFSLSLILSGCLSLTADKPALTNSPSTYLVRSNDMVTISITIPDTRAATRDSLCTLYGDVEGELGHWSVGTSEYQDTRLVRFSNSSQSYRLLCQGVDRGPSTASVTLTKYPTLETPALGMCNLLCVNGAAINVVANCTALSFCSTSVCSNPPAAFTGTRTVACTQ